jgi:chromosome segregation ATPase
MAQDMSFAQALTEARQIIVQQSGRIKSDLEKIKSLQETIASQSASVIESEKVLREQGVQIARHAEVVAALNAKLREVTTAKEQAEAINDRQGQRLTQMQQNLANLEQQVADYSQRLGALTQEIHDLRHQVPTQEDADALAALSNLLSSKKSSASAASAKSGSSPMRITGDRAVAA